MPNSPAKPELPRYRQIAAQIEQAIATGSLPPSTRLPSIRRLMAQYEISMATAVAALRVLEDRRLVEARPKSGYFVAPRETAADPAPRFDGTPQPVDVHARVYEFIGITRAQCGIRFDNAVGAPELYPAGRIERLYRQLTHARPERLVEYPHGTGHPALKAQLARHLVDAGCTLGPDDFVVTHGATEALQLALRAVTRPGDTVAVGGPAYFGILQALESLGLKVLELPCRPGTGLSLDVLDFATAQAGAVQAVVVMANFHNPLGSLMPDEAKRQLVALLARRGIPLIEDDTYGDLHHGPQRPAAAKAWDHAGNVMLLGSFTKTLVPGMRIGWIAPGRWKAEVERLKFIGSIATPELPQAVIAEFLAHGGWAAHLRRLRRALREQTGQLRAALSEVMPAGTRVTAPAGGMLLWVELPETVPGSDGFRLYQQAYAEGIGVAPGNMFSASNRFDHCLRLNAGYPWTAERAAAVRRLGALARQLMAVPAPPVI